MINEMNEFAAQKAVVGGRLWPNFYGHTGALTASTQGALADLRQRFTPEEEAKLEEEKKRREEVYRRRESLRQEAELVLHLVRSGKSVAEATETLENFQAWAEQRTAALGLEGEV